VCGCGRSLDNHPKKSIYFSNECKLKVRKEKESKKKLDKLTANQSLFESQKLFPGLEAHLVKEARRAKKHKPGKIVPFRMLWENARYELCFKRRKDEYALNNNTQGLWARYLMKEHPELDKLFETRGM
jgi:hypothetical protein